MVTNTKNNANCLEVDYISKLDALKPLYTYTETKTNKNKPMFTATISLQGKQFTSNSWEINVRKLEALNNNRIASIYCHQDFY